MLIDIKKYDVKWFVNLFNSGNLIVNHDYQRRGVWLHVDRVKLVETILLGLPIPEVYIWQRDTDPASGETKYEIVDGQQRLSAVIEYVANAYALEERYLDKENNESSFSNKRFDKLEDDDRQNIWKYNFVTRVIDSSESQENITQMFLRLNRTNLSLNPQELRNARFNGEFLKLSIELSQLEFWNKYRIFNHGDIRRMLDVQLCSSILIFLRMGIQTETQNLINRVYDRYNEDYPEKEEDKATFFKMIDVVDQFFIADKSLAQKKTQIFTIFNLAYYYVSSNSLVNEQHLENFKKFCFCYNLSNENLGQISMDKDTLQDLITYKDLSIEGVGKKFHREQRFFILKKLILDGI